jgi:2-methylaconitate cis-trans-isomerase PrpF
VLPGVSGTGAPIELIYPDPAGSRTSGLLPTGQASESVTVDGAMIEVSLVDATLPVVIVPAAAVGLNGDETPDEIDANAPSLRTIEDLRRNAAVRMGLCSSPRRRLRRWCRRSRSSRRRSRRLLDGDRGCRRIPTDAVVRMISMGQTHKAVPGTGAMCLAAAAQVPGTIINGITGAGPELRLGTPSGVVTAGAVRDAEQDAVTTASLFRTARVLMRGQVAVRD